MLNKDYFISKPLTYGYTDSLELFATGHTAMIMMGSWEFLNLSKIGGKDFELGAFFFPGTKAKKPLVYPCSIGDLFAISAQTKNPEACKEVLSYFAERGSDLQLNFGGISTLKKSTAVLSPALSELHEDFIRSDSYTFVNNQWPSKFSGFNTLSLIAGNKTVEQMLIEADKSYDSAIAQKAE